MAVTHSSGDATVDYCCRPTKVDRGFAAPKAESTAAAEKDHCDIHMHMICAGVPWPEVDLCWGSLARGASGPYYRCCLPCTSAHTCAPHGCISMSSS
eukprot:4476266-Pyramimonas_sp.AAC.2